jgi:hypothetical protein
LFSGKGRSNTIFGPIDTGKVSTAARGQALIRFPRDYPGISRGAGNHEQGMGDKRLCPSPKTKLEGFESPSKLPRSNPGLQTGAGFATKKTGLE